MAGHEMAVKSTIFDPDFVVKTAHKPTNPSGERRTACKLGAHPSHPERLVQVAIEYGADGRNEENFIVTAFVAANPPKGDLNIVSLH